MCLTSPPKTVRQTKATTSRVEQAEKYNNAKTKVVAPTHSLRKRETKYDLLLFLIPALFWKLTPIFPAYITGVTRILSTHILLTFHYIFCDKDNYNNKLTHKQLMREKEDYLVGIVLHMYAQIVLQLIFPGMFFSDNSMIKYCMINTFWSHILVVEPLYYFAHRWLHIPEIMKAMHGFHHLSIHTLPSTSLVQNFNEHFIYIAAFGPAFLLPYFVGGCQHWVAIAAYLIIFDIINAFGHMNIRVRNMPLWTSKWSPLRYLFYTPEFHLGHHAYFRANYGLFMPFWDIVLGTHREYLKPDPDLLPSKKQDFVFIGHNGGLGHLLTCPEFSVYNAYDKYRFFLPLQVEFLLVHAACLVCRLFMKSYKVSRYLINGENIGRIICVLKTPVDYIYPSRYEGVNKEIIQLIKDENKECGTRYFGLGNLNKMKQLNDGGKVITEMIRSDPELNDKKIRVWTGDTMTAASVYNQIVEIPGCDEIFYIGANGKLGNAVCNLITKNYPNMKIKVFSSYESMKHPNISYTTDLTEMMKYRVVISGKIIPGHKYSKAFKTAKKNDLANKTRFVLDYTVPFIPIDVKMFPEIQHIPIGLLRVNNKSFLRGHFDVCMSHDQDHIYPCHAGCIMASYEKRETDEVGDIDLDEMEAMWKKALNYGFQNRIINYKCD